MQLLIILGTNNGNLIGSYNLNDLIINISIAYMPVYIYGNPQCFMNIYKSENVKYSKSEK